MPSYSTEKKGVTVRTFLHKGALAAAIALVVVAMQAYSIEAAATVVDVNEFAVMRSGTTIFDDSFNRNATLNGGPGTMVPSGTTFSDDSAANYFVQGVIPETTANNGQAHLNTANGRLIAQPPPSLPLIREVAASLSTGTDPAGPHALTPSNTFSAIALFDLALPAVALGRYDVFLTNNTATPGRNIQIQIRQTDTGPLLQFQWFDNIAHQNTIIDQVFLTPVELADPQLELGFAHDSTSSDVVTALYAFGSGNTFASFNGALTALGSTDSSTDVFTPTLDWAQSGFETIDPVPEPASGGVVLTGLTLLAVLRRYCRPRFAQSPPG